MYDMMYERYSLTVCVYLSISLSLSIHIYIYICEYISNGVGTTPNLPTNIVDVRGFDSSIILNLRGGILRPIGNLPEILSQAMLVRIMLVGNLGVMGSLQILCFSTEGPLGFSR